MKPRPRPHLLLAAAVLLLAGSQVQAADEVPSFRKRSELDKAFVTKVGTAVIKAARKPGKITYAEHKETTKDGVTTLTIKMDYKGLVLKKTTYHSTITLKINTKEKDNWKVTDIEYKDDTKSVAKPNMKKVRELIPQFNK
jgi:hypothetical protein